MGLFLNHKVEEPSFHQKEVASKGLAGLLRLVTGHVFFHVTVSSVEINHWLMVLHRNL